MKLCYYPETDSLYVELAGGRSARTLEIADGVVVDLDTGGNLVGIDIDQATQRVELAEVEISGLATALVRQT